MNTGQTENKADDRDEKGKNYFQKSNEWLKARLQPLWKDIKKNAHSAIFWLQVLGLVGLAAYVTIAAIQWHEMHRALILSASPFLDIYQIRVITSPTTDTKVAAILMLVNGGKSPAKNARIKWKLQVGPPAGRLCMPRPPLDWPHPSYVAEKTYEIPVVQDISVQQRQEHIDRKAQLLIWGRISYDDFFSETISKTGLGKRDSVFCGSLNISKEQIIKGTGQSTLIMFPCSHTEWPMTDLFEKEEWQYGEPCKD